MTGTAAGRSKLLILCPRMCGRMTQRGREQCYECAVGAPLPGEVRYCEVCEWPMKRARTRRICGSCRRRQQHRDGVFAKAALHRGDRWTPEEEAELIAMAGTLTAAQIGKKIGRSKWAVNIRAHTLGVYLQADDWTMARLCKLFGAWEPTVRKAWIESGQLKARKLGPREHCLHGEWRIREQDIEDFIASYPWAYDASRMFPQSHRLAQMAIHAQRREPYVTVVDVCSELGLSESAVVRWIVQGVIPSKRRHVGQQGGRSGTYVIRAADVAAAGAEIRRRQVAARQAIRDGLAAFNQRRRQARQELVA